MADIFDNQANIQMMLQGAQMFSNTLHQAAQLRLQREQFEAHKQQFVETQRLEVQKMKAQEELARARLEQDQIELENKKLEFQANLQQRQAEEAGTAQRAAATLNLSERKFQQEMLESTATNRDKLYKDLANRENEVSANATANLEKIPLKVAGSTKTQDIIIPPRYRGLSNQELQSMVQRDGDLTVMDAFIAANPGNAGLVSDSAATRQILDALAQEQRIAMDKDEVIQALRKKTATIPLDQEGVVIPKVRPLSQAVAPSVQADEQVIQTDWESRAAKARTLDPADADTEVARLAKDFRAQTMGKTGQDLKRAASPILTQLGTPALISKFMAEIKKR